MNFQIDVSSSQSAPAEPPPEPRAPSEVADLLRQMLEVQREQLAYQRAAHDMTARWRAYLARWQHEFPDLSSGCRRIMPQLERCYGQLISDLTEKLGDEDAID